MTWTYQDTMPTSKDKVRFFVGDTVSTAQKLTDEEIEFAISEAGNIRSAAAICCDKLAAVYTALVDTQVGTLRLTYSNKAKQYQMLAAELRSRAALQAMPSAGGILVSDKQANQDNDLLVKPSFSVDILDSQLVGRLNTDQGTFQDQLD